MPSRAGILTSKSGFLQPTFSSSSKVTQKNRDISSSNRKTQIARNNRQEKAAQTGENYENHTETQLSMLLLDLRTHNNDVCTDLSLPISDSPQKMTPTKHEDDDTSPFHLKEDKTNLATLTKNFDHQMKEAQTICNELRQEIEDLKMKQQQLLGSMTEGNDIDKKKDSQSSRDKIGIDANTLDVTVESPLKQAFQPSTVEPSISDFAEQRENAPNTSAGTFVTPDIAPSLEMDDLLTSCECRKFSPERLIKTLFSERERYKKKARLLRRALHKAEDLAMITFPRDHEIALRDIAYSSADLIGEGLMSYVYSGKIFKKRKAAIKKLVRPEIMSASDRSYLAVEAVCLTPLRHPNVLRVYGVSTTPLEPLIISELVNGGNLHERLHSRDAQMLNPGQYCCIFRDVSNGMKYLHGKTPPILHLNLRPCNVLFRSNGRAKVADFGFSKIRLEAGIENHKALSYFAPELMECPSHLTKKLDVFSFAVILWEMASMQIPYEDMSAWEIFEFVTSGGRLDIPAHLPSGFADLISKCWDASPMRRPSFKELTRSLETMELPLDWTEAKNNSVNRSNEDDHIIMEPSYNIASSKGFHAQHGSLRKKHHNMADIRDKTKRKLSQELALESDMMSMGYSIPKANCSYKNYPTTHYARPWTDADRERVEIEGKRSVKSRQSLLTPEKMGVKNVHCLPSTSDVSAPGKRISSKRGTASNGLQSGNPLEEQKHDIQPIARKDLRYVDQDLTVETPKIIPGWNRGDVNGPGSRWSAGVTSSLREEESLNDVRTALSVPYLKHQKSEEMKAPSKSIQSRKSSSQSTRYHDVPPTYNESRAYFAKDFFDRGWQSTTSVKLNQKRLVPSLGDIEGSDNDATSSDSREEHADLPDSQTETGTTASSRPTDREGSSYERNTQQHDDVITPTERESFGDSQIRVVSVPSNFQLEESERGDLSYAGNSTGNAVQGWTGSNSGVPTPPERVSKKQSHSRGVDQNGTESRDENAGSTTDSMPEEESGSASNREELNENQNTASAVLRETAQDLNTVTAILEAAAEEAEK